MPIDPELLKQLIDSFRTELGEHTQAITNGLLSLEKNNLSDDEKRNVIEIIFRSAHNIKGTSRSLGIYDVGEIAHRVESLFSTIQKKIITITPSMINICLEAVDKMQIALSSFIEKKSLPFDLQKFLKNLELDQVETNTTTTPKPMPIKKEKKASTLTEHDSIRVPISKIDKVSSILEEIQINKIAIMDHFSALTQLMGQTKEFAHLWKQISSLLNNNLLLQAANDVISEINTSTQSMHNHMRSRVNELTTLSHSLQEEVQTLRMIPVGNLLCTFPRYVRDLSQELNKQVELIIKGDDIKVDKAVLEGLKDPIIHLLRNAVDHGIEAPKERLLNSKSEIGRISIEIKEEGSQILISITDDGAGIDVNKISEIAENKKLLTHQDLKKLNENEILQFIFLSGFSTKEIITDVSGRGIGLDVVKSNIEELKGQVTVSSVPKKGTTFTLTVPISISSERGLLIKCADEYFVIPTTSVERILLLRKSEIADVQGGQAIQLDQRTIPVRMLADILQLENKSFFAEDRIPMVIVKKSRNAIAFITDEIVGEREIVLKPFQAPILKVTCIAGGTLLESNQVAIVLELGDLINLALKHQKMSHIAVQKGTVTTTEKPHILVVDDSITTRTLEKNVLESKNYQVTVAVNGKEAWDMLQKQKFSLLITDVVMPIMDGFTLTERVKKSENLRGIPVIIVTSLGSDTEKKRGIEVGADAYIVKNEFESGALLEVVSQLI